MVTKKLLSIALVAVAVVLAAAPLSYAAPHGGHGPAGHSPVGHFGGHAPHVARPAFVPHPGFHGDRHFVRGPHVGVFVGAPFIVPSPVYPYYYPPTYTYEPAPNYWYYCQSYGQYYPNVASCPEPWVTVPAQ
jgi:hypothetical protein